MKLRPVYLFLTAVSLVAAACTSSSSSTIPAVVHGTETLSAEVAGAAAAANLNSNSNAPLDFSEATFTGPVSTTIKPFALTGNANSGTVHWATPDGTVAIFHQSAPGYTNQNAPPPATWTKTGTTCGFSATFSKGAFRYVPAQSTGTWKRIAGIGTYLVTAQGSAPLKSGKSTCSFTTVGKVADSGAKITFSASAPVTLNPATATP